MSLYERLKVCFIRDKTDKENVSKAFESGHAFFSQFNRDRMELAFSIFSEDMKKALFEVIFFLHINDPKYKEHKFMASRIERVHGVMKEVEYEAEISLYVEGSPSGVVGISDLAPVFKDEFATFIQGEFGEIVNEGTGFAPIYSIASLGSIGTIGHKETASDLDLQIQYEYQPFLWQPERLTDDYLKKYSTSLIDFFSKKYRIVKKISKIDLNDKKARIKIKTVGHKNYKKRFPLLYDYLFLNKTNIISSIITNRDLRDQLSGEFHAMLKLHTKICLKKELTEREQLLKERIRQIQSYVQKKYPQAEVYLFAYSNDDYRDGKHGTTLESKEASGSAYELILNYEVLMPGIQFTPMIPIHFLMPNSINSNRSSYEGMIDKIRFQFVNLYDNFRNRLVDLGSTPPLTVDYMVSHAGAVYWESFKASSGNLPKAMLNLLRFEMLFDDRFNTSVIELIKNPKRLDQYASDEAVSDNDFTDEHDDYDFEQEEVDEVDDFYDDYGLETVEAEDNFEDSALGIEDNPEGLSINQLFEIEKRFPALGQDPWWLRYKALKIGFGPKNKTVDSEEEKQLISRVIDLGFALHIRISDIFKLIRESKKPKTYREKVLALFLDKAFTYSRRSILEHISNGEVETVINFEKELKFLFQQSMNRVQKQVENSGGEDKTNQDENRIWFHYYQMNFDPPSNVVRRDILSHLKVPRGRLQIGINDQQKWFFRSIQKSTLGGGLYNTFGQLDHLPDEVDLFEHDSFLHGIAHCLLNGYYGILNKGTLKESRTILEYAVAHTEIGKKSADKFAFIRPDIVDRLVDSIDKAFPPQEYDFRDCIYKEKAIVNVFICLNLLEYGRLSFMYRDNLKNWYVDKQDHQEIESRAETLYHDQLVIFTSTQIQFTVKKFFDEHSIDFDELSRSGGLSFWVNPNSVKTYHSEDKYNQKEEYLAREFGEAVYNFNSGSIGSEQNSEGELGEELDVI